MEADITTNKLTHLPDSIGLMNRLCVLNVSDNRLEDLPISLGLLYGLQVKIYTRERDRDRDRERERDRTCLTNHIFQSLYLDGNSALDEVYFDRASKGMGMAHNPPQFQVTIRECLRFHSALNGPP